jgi:hypothetical protein
MTFEPARTAPDHESNPSGNNQPVAGLVRAEGLEPPRLSSLEPKSSASTNSATPAREKRGALLLRARLYNTAGLGCTKKVAVRPDVFDEERVVPVKPSA